MRYIVIFKRQYLGSDLADMQLITKLNKSFFFFYYVFLIFIIIMRELFL